MWRSACAFLLLPSLIWAQSQDVATQSAAPKPGAQEPGKAPTYKQYTYYREIRRGTTEKAAIDLVLNEGFVTLAESPVPGILPLKLELDAAEGIKVRTIKYPKPFARSFSFRQGPIKGTGTYRATMKFKIQADKQATLGMHTLKGKLTFQTVTSAGISEPQQLDVEIPLNVVGRHAKVNKAWPYYEMPKGEIGLLIVLTLVLLPLVVPFIIICGAKGDCD